MTDISRPTVRATAHSQLFWDGCAQGVFQVQCCEQCDNLQHYPQPMCGNCQSTQLTWKVLSGTGKIYSYTICHRAFHPFWKDKVPYVLATIELDEGVRVVSDILDLAPENVAIGLDVTLFFEDSPGVGQIPRFRVVEQKS